MPAVSRKQQRFFGMVRAAQKGELGQASPEVSRVAADISKKDAKDFASTKHKGLPEKKMKKEDYKYPLYAPAHKVDEFHANKIKLDEEEYDHYRDKQLERGTWKGGGGRPSTGGGNKSKGKTVLQKQAEKKYGKGKSALDMVKADIIAKHGKGAIMDTSKKKNEEVEIDEAKVDMKTPDYKRATVRDKRYGNPHKSFALGGGIRKDRRADHEARRGVKTKGRPKNPHTVDEEVINERGDFWHPDPEKDKKLGGPGANQRAREDRAAASKPKEDPKKLRKGESYMDYAKRQPGYKAPAKKKSLLSRLLKKEEFVDEAAYTGPDKKDRAVIKKMDNKKFAAKLADYEKNMDPKKRQALKDKATKGMKFVHEEGAPTMNTGSNASAAGFSSDADENGPTAGMDQPLGGTAKLKGKGPKLTKKKAKCKKSPDGINKICESTEARYLSFLVQMDDVEFIFQGKSPADVKIRLRKIYRPERLKGIKITRMLPAQVMHYYWEKRQAAM